MAEPRVQPLVAYFEIPVTDLDRAERFYTAVFGYAFQRAEIDGHPMALFPDSTHPGRITGALVLGESYTPGRAGARLYFAVERIDAVLARALEHGGRTLYPKTDIGENGFVAEFEDSEGNCIALLEPHIA
jgi:predicted enzyme related to lactoylglutathione lyase